MAGTLRNATTKIIVKVLPFLFLFFTSAPLFAFELSVTKTDETCPGNGALAFSVTGVPAGATVSYSIYKHPDLVDDIETTSASSYGGLTAGMYRVVASVTASGVTTTDSVDIQIFSTVVPLEYQLVGQAAICGDNGSITVNVTQGMAVGYEIVSGPSTFPLQTSNVFTGLAAGVYEIRVFDDCGEGVVQTHTLFEGEAGMNINIRNPVAGDCDTIFIGININDISTTSIAYPLEVECTIVPQNGPPISFSQTITSGSLNGVIYTEEIPYEPGTVLTYTITVTDNCGNVQVINSSISNFSALPSGTVYNQTCTGGGISIMNITGLVLTSAPDAFQGSLPIDYTGQITINNTWLINQVPTGIYEFTALDLCGEEVPITVNVEPTIPGVPTVNVFEGCDTGVGSIFLSGDFEEVIMTGAPDSFPHPIPYDVSAFIDLDNHGFVMGGLPPGTYTFAAANQCGGDTTISGTIQGYQENTEVNIIEHCGAFDLQLAHTSNASGTQSFWLQKYFPLTNSWGHPVTGAVYVDGSSLSPTNSLLILNNAINYNLAFYGVFRLMKSYPTFSSGSAVLVNCTSVIFDFELIGQPRVDNIFSFSCGSGNFDVIVEASGMMPLKYRITSKNGAPFLVENGTANVFNGLSNGIYNFQVEDPCGNIVNRLFDISEPLAFSVSGSAQCIGQTGQISVPDFPFLNYQWWKNGASGTVLSSDATLSFSPFTAAQAGLYHVRIWNPDASSCLDLTLDYLVEPNPTPLAGTGTSTNVCGNPTPITLTDLLVPPFDLDGQWTASSGTISNGIWTPDTTDFGQYVFTYTVEGICEDVSATAEITFHPQPEMPAITGEVQVCEGSEIILLATGTNVFWEGPNGFTFPGSELTIESATAEHSGIYTLTSTNGFCTSDPVEIEIAVAPAPDFTIEQFCDGSTSTLVATSTATQPNASTLTFTWNGPNGFSASGNPVAITNAPIGAYSLEVTSDFGCRGEGNITVTQTLCTIPLAISPNQDGLNDSLDLSGLGVQKLQIFNRYGVTVFEKNIYKDEWRGQDYKDRPLPDGTYFYLAALTTGDHRTGWIYVLREN